MRISPMNRRALVLSLVLLAGCAAGPELQLLREQRTSVELTDVPFFVQDQYQCGPAALATVLVSGGVEVTPPQLVSQVYVPDRRGSLQAELIAATRSHDRVPYVMSNCISPILEALHAGYPVLVLQNLGVERWPVWHYAVLIGFDAEKEQFLLRSGTTRRQRSSARAFLASWDRAGRWSMVVVPANAPPAGADVLGWLQALAPFESTGDLETAAEGYEAAVARLPESGVAWTALGNVRYLQHAFAAAAIAYEHALASSPDLWVARNNLVRTMIAQGCPDQAKAWVRDDAVPPTHMQPMWRDTLQALAEAQHDACPRPKQARN